MLTQRHKDTPTGGANGLHHYEMIINLFGNYIKARKYRDASTRISELIHNFRRGLEKQYFVYGEKQIKLVRDFNWFDSDILSGAGDKCTVILAKSELISAERSEKIANAIKQRVGKIQLIQNLAENIFREYIPADGNFYRLSV